MVTLSKKHPVAFDNAQEPTPLDTLPAGLREIFEAKPAVAILETQRDSAMINGLMERITTLLGLDLKGGIDLNGANLDLRIKRDGNGVPLPFVQQDPAMLDSIDGLQIFILNIQPILNTNILSELRGGAEPNALAANTT